MIVGHGFLHKGIAIRSPAVRASDAPCFGVIGPHEVKGHDAARQRPQGRALLPRNARIGETADDNQAEKNLRELPPAIDRSLSRRLAILLPGRLGR